MGWWHRVKSIRHFEGQNSAYKFYWCGNKSNLGGAGFLLAEKWTHNAFEVHRVSDRILVLRLLLGESVFTFVSVYAPQVGRPNKEKTIFYHELQKCISKIPSESTCKDWFKVIKYIFSYSNPYPSVLFGITIYRKKAFQVLEVSNLLNCDSFEGYTDHARFSSKLHGFGFLAIYFYTIALNHSVLFFHDSL